MTGETFSLEECSVVVHCADMNYVEDFAWFIREVLRLPKGTFFPFIVLGGASSLAHPREMKEQYGALIDQILTCRVLARLGAIHLFTHKDCRFCTRKLGRATVDTEREKHQLVPAAAEVRRIAPGARIVGHYAWPHSGTLKFESKEL